MILIYDTIFVNMFVDTQLLKKL